MPSKTEEYLALAQRTANEEQMEALVEAIKEYK